MDEIRSGETQELGWLRRQVADWRANREKHGPMPGRLWQAAIELAQRHGVGNVARGARLDYGSLKRRVDEAEVPGFVELSAAEVFGGAGTVLEVIDGSGGQLTIRLAPGAQLDVIELVRSFREGAR